MRANGLKTRSRLRVAVIVAALLMAFVQHAATAQAGGYKLDAQASGFFPRIPIHSLARRACSNATERIVLEGPRSRPSLTHRVMIMGPGDENELQVDNADQQTNSPISPTANSFEPAVRTVWEFGLEIVAADKASGITATVPVPMDWPEQTVKLLDEHRSNGVGKFKHRDITKEAKQAQFNVNRMSSEQNAVAFQRFEVLRRPIIKPKQPDLLKIADPVPGKVKRFLKPSPYIESRHQRIRDIASELKEAHGEGSAWDWVEAIYRYVREKVEYKFDTQIHSCLDALESGHGDCEELSSLFIAICRASDIPARAVWVPGHTYPEFYLVDSEGTGHWFPCQAAGIYEFGEMNETRPVLQKGDRFRLPGQREPIRYVRPTLLAKKPGGGISLKWIARETTGAVLNENAANPNSDFGENATEHKQVTPTP